MGEKMVTLTIDGQSVTVPLGTTILEAAKQANIHIPTLCYLKGINEIGACRMCIVEIKGAKALQASCVYPVADGMEVKTNSPAIREARRVTLELLLSNHDRNCLTCVRNGNCELQKLADELNIQEIRFEGERLNFPIDDLSPAIVRDPNKCVLCRRCVSVCRHVQKIGVIGATERGFNTIIEPPFKLSINEVPCINCGQCIEACPVGALREKDDTERVWTALADSNLHVIVQTAPAVRAALGEEFGLPVGSMVKGKMVAALRRLGFDKVFDTDFAADLTIMEEGTELLDRLQNGGKLPLITSCSPGWVKYCEHYYPEFLDNLSTCKSPHEMMGAILKSYYAEKMGLDPAKIFVVSVMPCTAKKFEAQRPELAANGYPDVDVVITTRELARMIKEAGIDFVTLPDESFDDPLGISTGAGVIFGVSGGVMEAALRTVAEIIAGKELENIEYDVVRGIEGIKTATIKVNDITIRAGVAQGTANAALLLERIKNGEEKFDFIEIMACPGGCINGGGQPILTAQQREKIDPRIERAKAIYEEDRNLPIRKSHKNPQIKVIYEEFLGKPNSHIAHQLLHTHYTKRLKYC